MVRLEPSRLREEAYALPLVSGVWVIVAVVLYNTVLLGYGPRGYGAPFLPSSSAGAAWVGLSAWSSPDQACPAVPHC